MSGLTRLPRLERGYLVALEASAGCVDAERIEGAVRLIESRGLRVLISRDLTARERYFAGADAVRLAGLQAALDNPEVRAIFLARGGYGSQRVAPLLKCPSNGPKAVVGFSDNTALHGYIGEAFGWPCLHGPHPRAECPEDFDRVVECLSGGIEKFGGLKTVSGGGPLAGPVAGGCLSLLSATFGTPCFPSLAGKIVFLEDTCEAPYRLDRMLTHLLQAGAFSRSLAVVFGELSSFAPQGTQPEEVAAVVEDFAARVGLPVLTGLPCGHVEPNFPLPLGIPAKLDPSGGTLEFLEAIVA